MLKTLLMLPKYSPLVRVPLSNGTRIPRDDDYERAEREERQGVDREEVRREADGGLEQLEVVEHEDYENRGLGYEYEKYGPCMMGSKIKQGTLTR